MKATSNQTDPPTNATLHILPPLLSPQMRELSFPKGGGIFQEIRVKKRLESARKSVTDRRL